MDFNQPIILVIGLLFFVSILASVASARVGAPLLLVFLFIGMGLGEDGLGIPFANVQQAHLIGSLALAVILFDGGLHTERNNFRVALKPAVTLATLGVVITAAGTGVAAMWILDLPLIYGLLLGAIVGSTDAAAVFALLHTARLELKQRVGATLEIESGSNDPMAIFLTVTLLELIVSGRPVSLAILPDFFLQMGLGGIAGLAGGWLSYRLINRVPLTGGLFPLFALSLGLTLFGITAALGGSGFLAIYLAGLVIGNSRVQSVRNILRFHNGMAWMSQIIMFLMLGLLAKPTDLLASAPQALLIALVLMFLSRPLAVMISLLPFRIAWREQAFISWVGLRGAVPIILALFPLLAGIEHAGLLFNVAFFVVLVSLVMQGWSLPFVARALRVDIPPTDNQKARLELDLPGQPDYELIGYRLTTTSPVLGRAPLSLSLPQGCKPALAVRAGRLHSMQEIQDLQAGDTLYLVAPPAAVPELDRRFLPITRQGHLAEHTFFGEFILHGSTPLRALQATYGIQPPSGWEDSTLHDYINAQFAQPVIGDRVRLDSVELVVKEMAEDGICSRVGLKLTPS